MIRRTRILLGLLLSSGISLVAYRRGSLSRSGIGGAIVTGTTTFGMGGWAWGLSLIFFFVSSSLFSHFREQEKAETAADKFSKGSKRDIGQVAANGGIATALALGNGLVSSQKVPALPGRLYGGTCYCYCRYLGHRIRSTQSAPAAPDYNGKACRPWYIWWYDVARYGSRGGGGIGTGSGFLAVTAMPEVTGVPAIDCPVQRAIWQHS